MTEHESSPEEALLRELQHRRERLDQFTALALEAGIASADVNWIASGERRLCAACSRIIGGDWTTCSVHGATRIAHTRRNDKVRLEEGSIRVDVRAPGARLEAFRDAMERNLREAFRDLGPGEETS